MTKRAKRICRFLSGRRWPAGLVVVVLAGLLLGGCATPVSPAPRIATAGLAPEQVARSTRNLRVFDTVWDLVNRKYYDVKFQGVDWNAAARVAGPDAASAADDDTLYASINRMIALLQDSHTHALAPARAREHRTRQRVRTGFNLMRIEDRWVVSDVLAGSPAEAAGVKSGWLVQARNGVALDSRAEFHPQEGEVAQWEFIDQDDHAVSLPLVATLISTAPRRESRLLEGGVVYLRFDGFTYATRRWLHGEVRRHRDAPALVIDLRSNPGGITFWMREMVGQFFEKKIEVGTFIRRGGAKDEAGSWQFGAVHYRGRVVVLVGSGSASASEIFSAVLQEQHRAVIVGRKTAGAVLASRFYALPDGGELQLSIEDYLTPGGRRLEGDGHGVEPDVPVTLTLADVRAGRDRDLEAALRILAAP